MKRRTFVGAMATVIAAPKTLLALTRSRTTEPQIPAYVVDRAIVRHDPLRPLMIYDADSELNVRDGDRVLVLRDLSGQGNHGFESDTYLAPGTKAFFFDRVLPGDEILQVMRGLGRTSQ